MSKRKIAIGAAAIILLIVGSVWAFLGRPDPQVEKVKQMLAEPFQKGATPEQERKNFELIHQEMGKLSPEQRQEVGHVMRETFERRMDQQMKTYFALPPQERIAYLDKQIDEMEKRGKEMQARRAQNDRAGGQGASGQASGGGQGGGRPQAGPGGGGPPGGRSSDARLVRRDAWLDRSTAGQRAERSAFMADMRARRIQRGLPANPFFGGGPRPR